MGREGRGGCTSEPEPYPFDGISADKCVYRPDVKLRVLACLDISREENLQYFLTIIIQFHATQTFHQLPYAVLIDRGRHDTFLFPEIIIAGIGRRIAESVTKTVKQLGTFRRQETMVFIGGGTMDIQPLCTLDD